MFPFIPTFVLAEVITIPPPNPGKRYITQAQEIRALPGQLNEIPVLNSNSPEVVKGEGILLSTFPQTAKKFPNAHLNVPISGEFEFFSHHIARPINKQQTLYQGVLVYNPSPQPVTLNILQGISYVTSPDAPFVELPPLVEDPQGRVFSGPGSRMAGDILRGRNQLSFPEQIIIPPQQTQMLFSLPIPTASARSTLLRLQSNSPVYLANLVRFNSPMNSPMIPNIPRLPLSPFFPPQIPALAQWWDFLNTGKLAEPRDVIPTFGDNVYTGEKVYGRVAGVSVGSQWTGTVVDRPGMNYLTIPDRGSAFSYPLSTVSTATLGTQQVQSAPLLARYPDTALRAHGNYGVRYSLTLPLYNSTRQSQTVSLSIQTPFKQNVASNRLTFIEPPQGQIFFRGTVRLSYVDDFGQNQQRYFHLVQRQGQQGEGLVSLNLPAGGSRAVGVELIYPPDATPPQVLTVKTLD
ncbi:MAG: DUF3370 domain-containing protein [Planktothrix agardhii]|jgi:hypothetical protein|uniref:DUF3370 domain-containing protein n=1 Tax=Planktothrix agardhii TaxID=1160 RepID=UPI000DBB4F0C|nr:hypothetical protein NIES204_28400 [Planktothrix agardhii NIES-204]